MLLFNHDKIIRAPELAKAKACPVIIFERLRDQGQSYFGIPVSNLKMGIQIMKGFSTPPNLKG